MPTVSIVIPVYKVEKYIERCLASVLNQTYQDYEIILVDDGSPDRCGEICDQYAQKYSFIKTIHKKNAGLGYARNTGIEAATGKYITFIDSDDYITESLLKDLVDAAVNMQADTVIAGYSRKVGNEIFEVHNLIADKQYKDDEIIPSVLYKMVGPLGDGSDNLNMAAWRVLYSIDIIKKYDLRYPSERQYISEDIIFDLYYYQYSKNVVGISNCGYIYCMNSGSLTERYNPDRYIKGEVLYKEKKRILELFDCYQPEAEYRIVESFIRYSRYSIKAEVKYANKNGREKALNNIRKIIASTEYIKAVKKHYNPNKSKIDALIDYLAIKNNALAIYVALSLGYIIRGKNDKNKERFKRIHSGRSNLL